MDIKTTSSPQAAPIVERVRHELKRRTLTIARTERLSPAMLRLHLTGEDLADFSSLAPDDHIKIFIPNPDGDPFMRDYTPRRFDTAARSLIIVTRDSARLSPVARLLFDHLSAVEALSGKA